MKFLKIDELVEGEAYKCRLSGLQILVKKIPEKETKTMTETIVHSWRIMGLYFSQGNGTYLEIKLTDYQLIAND